MFSSFKKPNIEIQGHRGERGLFPENTLSSFICALESGVDALEFDLHLTLDKEVIIYHDYTINSRVCVNADGSEITTPLLVSGLTLAQVQQFDIGSKKSLKHPDQTLVTGSRIPTLKQLFDAITAHPMGANLLFNCEIKRDVYSTDARTPSSAELAEAVYAEVTKCNFQHRVKYSSFDFEILRHLRKMDSCATLAVLSDDLEGLAQKVVEIEAQIASPDFNALLSATDVESLKNCFSIFSSHSGPCRSDGISESKFGSFSSESDVSSTTMAKMCRVVVFTPNTKEAWTKLINMGIDGIITDYPRKLLEMLGSSEETEENTGINDENVDVADVVCAAVVTPSSRTVSMVLPLIAVVV